ncbi:MAG TPA: hypothetical protein PKD17_15430, partial [Cellvibrionaceae bacterium]|nr:hypothetical protein [Cellvibrionaceae bacterium]
LAQACLKRRIPVLLEHPVLPSHCSDLLALAQAMDVRLHINSHFSLLPPAQEFIQLCRALNSQAQPLSVQISCNSRTLFSLLDIAQAIFGLFNFEALCSDALDAEEHYYQMRFKLNKIPCIVHYQNWRSAQDDSLDSPLGHQCTITYPQGIMQLNSSFGPCLWFPLMAATTGVAYPAYSSLSRLDQAPTHADIIAWREDANIQAIESLITPDEDQFTQTPVYLTHLCQNWHTLFTAHGFKVAPPQVNKLTDIFFTAKQLVCSAKR